MRVTPIRDVLRMDKGDTVDAIKGEIKTIYKIQNVGKRGGTLQSIVLTDGRDEIKIKLWDREDEIPTNWKGKYIHIVASGDRDKDALTVDEYKGDIQLNVPKTAEVAKGTDMSDDADRGRDRDRDDRREDRREDREDRREDRSRDDRRDDRERSSSRDDDRERHRDDPPDDRSERRREPKQPDDLEDPKIASRNVTLARVCVARCSNLYKVSLMASDHVANWWKDKHGEEMPVELYKAMAHGFYMDLRAADHDERMPVHDITEYLISKPKKKKEPEDKKEPAPTGERESREGGAE